MYDSSILTIFENLKKLYFREVFIEDLPEVLPDLDYNHGLAERQNIINNLYA